MVGIYNLNGDVGKIRAIDVENQVITTSFDEREVDYDFADQDELTLAHAVSVHKSQGSEYPAVVIAVLTQHYALPQVNLIYAAETTARRLVVMLGTKKPLQLKSRTIRLRGGIPTLVTDYGIEILRCGANRFYPTKFAIQKGHS